MIYLNVILNKRSVLEDLKTRIHTKVMCNFNISLLYSLEVVHMLLSNQKIKTDSDHYP